LSQPTNRRSSRSPMCRAAAHRGSLPLHHACAVGPNGQNARRATPPRRSTIPFRPCPSQSLTTPPETSSAPDTPCHPCIRFAACHREQLSSHQTPSPPTHNQRQRPKPWRSMAIRPVRPSPVAASAQRWLDGTACSASMTAARQLPRRAKVVVLLWVERWNLPRGSFRSLLSSVSGRSAWGLEQKADCR
jgi:hypothetical protein